MGKEKSAKIFARIHFSGKKECIYVTICHRAVWLKIHWSHDEGQSLNKVEGGYLKLNKWCLLVKVTLFIHAVKACT